MQTVLLKAVNVQKNTMESIKWTYHEERSIATTLFFWKFNF